MSHQIPFSVDCGTYFCYATSWLEAGLSTTASTSHSRVSIFFLLFSHFRHFLCPFVPSYPFHPWSGRRLSPRAVRGVSVTPLATRSTPWRTPRNLLPINSRFCQQPGIISPSINSPGAVLEQFTLLKGLFTFYGQVKKKPRRSGGMKYHKNLTL